jgi:hypothetical protein
MKWRINPYARLFQYRAFVSVIPVQWIIIPVLLAISSNPQRERQATERHNGPNVNALPVKELNRFKRKEPLRAE